MYVRVYVIFNAHNAKVIELLRRIIVFINLRLQVPPSGGGGGMGFYLLRIAATGSIFAACEAGMIPAKIPTAIQMTMAVNSMGNEM